MNNKFSALILLAGLFTGSAMAAYNGPSETGMVSNAKTASQANDGVKAHLSGKIIKSLGDEKYVFQDGTGEITVDIDDELVRNLNFDEQTPIVIVGEVDNDWNSQEVDVDMISLVPVNVAPATTQTSK